MKENTLRCRKSIRKIKSNAVCHGSEATTKTAVSRNKNSEKLEKHVDTFDELNIRQKSGRIKFNSSYFFLKFFCITLSDD
uniref:Uncharacterized protein n=1 Tax=Pyxicephalus adspersus TaxID=30357 RepID=A0AAV3A107_PYXAD|nr:TPA: hypothetical protein GDO54_015793 [Pyxicephalus adspersus]